MTPEELKADFELHIQAGLIHVETIGDEDIWMGSDSSWREYESLAGWELLLAKPE